MWWCSDCYMTTHLIYIEGLTMEKGFVLVDIPETCLDCRFCREIDEGIEACCELELDPTDNELIREIDVIYTQEKPDWCPIRKFPENDTKIIILTNI